MTDRHDEALCDVGYQRKVAGLSFLTDKDWDGSGPSRMGLDRLTAYIERSRAIEAERDALTRVVGDCPAVLNDGSICPLEAPNGYDATIRRLRDQNTALRAVAEADDPEPLREEFANDAMYRHAFGNWRVREMNRAHAREVGAL